MLRIKKYLFSNERVEDKDFSLIPFLNKKSPSYDKGRKTKSQYLGETGELVVEKIFEDIVVGGKLTSLKMTINWYNENDTVGLTKEQVIKNFNKAEVKTELRKRRNRAIDYLTAAAEGTPVEQYVNDLFKHYSNEIQLYISAGSNDFENAINGETVEPYLTYLNIIVEPPSTDYPNGKTVKDSILYQIT